MCVVVWWENREAVHYCGLWIVGFRLVNVRVLDFGAESELELYFWGVMRWTEEKVGEKKLKVHGGGRRKRGFYQGFYLFVV